LTGSAPSLMLESADLTFRQKGSETELSGGKVKRFAVGETVAALEFEVTPAGLLKLTLNGPFLDLRSFLNNEDTEEDKPYEAPPMQLSVSVDSMRTADNETIGYGKIFADIDGAGQFNQLEL